MNNLIISFFGDQILLEILNELKLFSKYKINNYDDLDKCINNKEKNANLIICYMKKTDNKNFSKFKNINIPSILITKSKIVSSGNLLEILNIPFNILDLEKKVISLLSKHQFKKRSLINLSGYIIDKNERKIKKEKLELQLTEKEIEFLVLFSEFNKPLNRNFILKKVWNYSLESDTHTVETHIHRLRKKIFDKFKDENFIKNKEEGYYI